MEKVNLFFQDANIDLKNELVDKYLGTLDQRILNNPSFTRIMYDALSFLTSKQTLSDHIPPIELSVSDDGKSFELVSGIRQDPDCMNPELKDNKNYRCVKFSIDEKGNLDVLKLNGTLFKFDSFAKSQEGKELGDKFKIFNSKDTPTVISVFHKNIMIMENGVEVSRSTYSDNYPLGISLEDEKGLRVQTSIHSPKVWRYNTIPDSAYFEFNPSVSTAFRFTEIPGVITHLSKSGKDSPVKGVEYAANTEYPEVLAANPTPVRIYNGRDGLKMNPEFVSYFSGMEEKDIMEEVEKTFAEGIEHSKTKEINPQAYESIRDLANAGLEKRYGITSQVEEVPQGLSF